MAELTNTQELLLVIFIVVVFKSIFVACLCKIQKCSEVETNYSMTPRAMCRYLCNKQETRDSQEVNVSPSDTTTSNDKPPPPYCGPPQYEEAVQSSPEWYTSLPPPPPYTIFIPENNSDSVISSDIYNSEVSNNTELSSGATNAV